MMSAGASLLKTTMGALSLMLAASLVAGDLAAQSNQKSTRAAGGARSTWTPERLQRAAPRPIPEVEATAPDLAPLAEPVAPRFSTGSPGSGRHRDALRERLYTPEPSEPEPTLRVPNAASPSSAVYTQSRVFPAFAVTRYPYRTTGRLFYHDPVIRADFLCSAAVIEQRLILTAGHCVFEPAGDYFFTDFLFVPALDRGAAPYGNWEVDWVIVGPDWFNGDGRVPNSGDFALLQTSVRRVNGERVRIGDEVGWLGFRTSAAANNHVTILGYPVNLDGGERLQATSAPTFRSAFPNAAEFGSQQQGGASGGPLIENFGIPASGQTQSFENRAVGVISYRVLSDDIIGTSVLNQAFSDIFDTACQRRPDNCLRLP